MDVKDVTGASAVQPAAPTTQVIPQPPAAAHPAAAPEGPSSRVTVSSAGAAQSSAQQQAQLQALLARAMSAVAALAGNPNGAAATVQQLNQFLQQAQQAGGGTSQSAAIVQQLGQLIQQARAQESTPSE